MIKVTVYLGIGTNLGDKEENIQRALCLLEESVGELLRCSSMYYSKPWGFVSKNDFVNVVAAFVTELSPHELLERTQQVEKAMGRIKKSGDGVYHDRVIDVDILLYGDQHVEEPGLVIPHPLMGERDFVMVPLNEIIKAR